MVPEEDRNDLPEKARIVIPSMTLGQRVQQQLQRMSLAAPGRMVTVRGDIVQIIVDNCAKYDVIAAEAIRHYRRIQALDSRDELTEEDEHALNELEDEYDRWMSLLADVLVTSWGVDIVPAPNAGSLNGISRIVQP